MSDERTTPGGPGRGVGPGTGPAHGAPEPEPIRFFGTCWLHHDRGYALRRVAVAAGSLLLTAVGALILRFAFQGLAIGEVGPLVTVLVIAGFAVCSALAFRRTWDGFVRRPDPSSASAADRSAQSLLLIGFLGSLLAYFCRSLVEAPGEKLRRAEYAAARSRHERRRTARTGNPAAKRAENPRKAKPSKGKRR